jgi:hypothetical protein
VLLRLLRTSPATTKPTCRRLYVYILGEHNQRLTKVASSVVDLHATSTPVVDLYTTSASADDLHASSTPTDDREVSYLHAAASAAASAVDDQVSYSPATATSATEGKFLFCWHHRTTY